MLRFGPSPTYSWINYPGGPKADHALTVILHQFILADQ